MKLYRLVDPDLHKAASKSWPCKPVKAITLYIHKKLTSALLHCSTDRKSSQNPPYQSFLGDRYLIKLVSRGKSQQLRLISFPTCYDYDRCQLGSCASPALLWQFHPGKFSQLQPYAFGFFLPPLLSPFSLLELAERSIRFHLLYPGINILFYFTTSWG